MNSFSNNNSDIKNQYMSRVKLLTQEIEKISEVLMIKGTENERLIMHLNQVQNENNLLKTELIRLQGEFYRLTDYLKQKTIEKEETSSQFGRLKEITLRDYEAKFQALQSHLEQYQNIIQSQERDLASSKEQFTKKIFELQEVNQQIFHLENSIKQIKDEKLKYIVEYQNKEKEVQQLNEQLQIASEFENKYKNLQVDIELIRQNYQALYEQTTLERQKYNDQLNIQRDVTTNSNQLMEQKYINLIATEKQDLKKEYENKILSMATQFENQIQSLNNIIGAKQMEIEKLQIQSGNFFQYHKYDLLINIAEKDKIISNYIAQNKYLNEMFSQSLVSLQEWEKKYKDGLFIGYDDRKQLEKNIEGLKNQMKQQQQQLQNLTFQNDQLKSQVLQHYDKSTLIEEGLSSKKKYYDKEEQNVYELKIGYLLKLIDDKNQELKTKDFLYQDLTAFQKTEKKQSYRY